MISVKVTPFHLPSMPQIAQQPPCCSWSRT